MANTRKEKQIWLLILVLVVCTIFFGYHLNRANFPELMCLYSILFLSFIFLLKWHDGPHENLFYAGLLLRVILIFAIPNLSQDFYRFIWDGRMLAAGYNPYLHLPNEIINNTHLPFADAAILYQKMGNLSASNYTNYPPLNQLIFFIAALFAGKSIIGSAIVFKLFIIAADIGSYFFGKKILQQINLPSKNIFIYFLNPLVLIELTGNLHFEGVMICLLLMAFYFLHQNKFALGGVLLACSIALKLVPLMLLPFFLRHLKWKQLGVFYSAALVSVIILFLPFLSMASISNYGKTISLWFVSFEFNASIYYVVREIGYSIRGYNIIHTIGKFSPYILLFAIMFFALLKSNKKENSLYRNMLFALTGYFMLSTAVHPWYIITPLILSIFTKYRFPLAWTFAVMFSYYAYSNAAFKESSLLLIIEYAVVFLVLLWELGRKKIFFKINF